MPPSPLGPYPSQVETHILLTDWHYGQHHPFYRVTPILQAL
jgi:hypothetical protein